MQDSTTLQCFSTTLKYTCRYCPTCFRGVQFVSSIAYEELGLSHIINAEGEKLQFLLGTLPGLSGDAATVEDVLNANETVRSLLEQLYANQIILNGKLQYALSAPTFLGITGTTGSIGLAITRVNFIITNNTRRLYLSSSLFSMKEMDGLKIILMPVAIAPTAMMQQGSTHKQFTAMCLLLEIR